MVYELNVRLVNFSTFAARYLYSFHSIAVDSLCWTLKTYWNRWQRWFQIANTICKGIWHAMQTLRRCCPSHSSCLCVCVCPCTHPFAIAIFCKGKMPVIRSFNSVCCPVVQLILRFPATGSAADVAVWQLPYTLASPTYPYVIIQNYKIFSFATEFVVFCCVCYYATILFIAKA